MADLMDEFDGIDIAEGTKGLNKFSDDVKEIIDCFMNYFNKFNIELSELWASPNAVDYNVDLNKMLNFSRNFAKTANNIIDTIVSIHSWWAEAHNEKFSDSIKRVEETGYDYICLTDSISSSEYGTLIGINPEAAKKSCEDFVSGCKDFVVPKISSLKIVTGVYDKGDVINQVNEEELAKYAQNVSDDLDTIQKTFDKKIKNEITELRLSVKSAEATLEVGPGQVSNHAVEDSTDTPKPKTTPQPEATSKPSSVIKPNNPSFDRISFF